MSERLERAIAGIKGLDEAAMEGARERQDRLTKPPGSLGRLEEISVRLAGIQGIETPKIQEKAVIVMAGDHGVIREKIVDWPQEVTAQMVLNFLHGGAGINAISDVVGARVVVVDMGVATDLAPHPALVSRRIARGTENMAKGPAMSKDQALRAVETTGIVSPD